MRRWCRWPAIGSPRIFGMGTRAPRHCPRNRRLGALVSLTALMQNRLSPSRRRTQAVRNEATQVHIEYREHRGPAWSSGVLARSDRNTGRPRRQERKHNGGALLPYYFRRGLRGLYWYAGRVPLALTRPCSNRRGAGCSGNSILGVGRSSRILSSLHSSPQRYMASF